MIDRYLSKVLENTTKLYNFFYFVCIPLEAKYNNKPTFYVKHIARQKENRIEKVQTESF